LIKKNSFMQIFCEVIEDRNSSKLFCNSFELQTFIVGIGSRKS